MQPAIWPNKSPETGSAKRRAQPHAQSVYKLALVIAGLLLGLIAGEALLRVAGFSSPDFEIVDRERGWALRPGASGWYLKEGHAYLTINSDGLRDREHPKRKPLRTVRIAVLGDSFAEANQVPMEQDFCSVMEQELNERCASLGARHAEVINFGVFGYGTAQELITLRRKVWSYGPDIVVLAFFTGNDVADNWPAMSFTRMRPFFVRRGGRLVLDNSFRESRELRLQRSGYMRLRHWIFNHVRVFQAIARMIQFGENVKHMGQDPKRWWRWEPGAATYKEPSDSSSKQAWDMTEELIQLMHEEVEARGARFLLVSLSTGIQVYPDPKVRADYSERNGISDLFYPDKRIAAFARAHSIEILTLAGPLQTYADEHHAFLHGFGNTTLGCGHWNALGHRIAGELIARSVCAMLAPLPESPSP